MDDGLPCAGAASLTERWWCLSWDREVERRQPLLTHLDGAVIALEEIIRGRPVPEMILFVTIPPPDPPTTSPEEVADQVRATIARRAVADARMAALIWLLKYVSVGTPRPMARLYPERRQRRAAKRALSRLRPRFSEVLPLEAARAAYAVLEEVEPRGSATPGWGAG